MSEIFSKTLNADNTITVVETAGIISTMKDYNTIANNAGTYAIDLKNQANYNAVVTVTANTAAIITASNVPARCDLFIELSYTDGASVTWTLNGGTVTWLAGVAPTLVDGKTYYVAFMTSNGGANWRANIVGGW